MRILLLIVSVFFNQVGFSQVDIPANFPNGDIAYNNYLQANLKFPEAGFKAKVSKEIRVLVQIDTNGKVTIESFIFPQTGLGFEDEVTTFINNMPNWTPAIRDGEISYAQTILTFNFTYEPPIEESSKKRFAFYKDCEVQPKYIGGKDSIETFLENVLTDSFGQYFDSITATIQFVIGSDGNVIFAEVLNNDSHIKNRLIVHAFKMLPNCIPGRINQKPVNVQRKMKVTLYSEEDTFDESDN